MSKIRRKKIKTSEWLFGLYRFRVEIEGTKAHILKSGGGNVESSRERERVGVGLVMEFCPQPNHTCHFKLHFFTLKIFNVKLHN